jgi:tetratricopeptide (TPR) repeat protein
MDPLAAGDGQPGSAACCDPPPPGRKSVAFLGVLTTVGLILAGYWSLRLGYADRLFHSPKPDSRNRAARAAPGNVRYLEDDDRARLRHNPYDSAAWIRLGLEAELAGDQASAESFLLRAAEVDKTYQPRWTLANFYFRRQRAEDFWLWARRAGEMAYQNQSALFDLCWRLSPDDPAAILRRAIPDRARILAQYLDYLLRRGRLEAAIPAARRLLPLAGGEERSLLVAYCDRLLEAGNSEAAVESWNRMASLSLIRHPPVDQTAGRSITNGDFAFDPYSGGFDWRIARVEGVAVTRLGPPAGIRFAFSGRQPERCTLVAQMLPVVPLKKFRLRFDSRADSIPDPSGLAWVVEERPGGGEIGRAEVLASELVFSTPRGCRLAALSLVYRRATGTTRIEGAYELRRVGMDFAE